jgi:hypothetical protein
LQDLSAKADVLRKEIAATTEGGAITGEERLREHTDELYGAINSYEGAPAAYQLTRIGVLSKQLAGVSGRFDQLAAGDLAARNRDLAAHKLEPITLPAPGPKEEAQAGGAEALSALAGYRFSLHPTLADLQGARAERD